MSLLASGLPVIHMTGSGGVTGGIKSGGAFFFAWTLLALGVTAIFSVILAVRYGLSASVWTRDLQKAHRVAAAIESGTVWVNTWLLRDLRVPFGGMKESGLGREGGFESLDFFTEAKNVCVKL